MTIKAQPMVNQSGKKAPGKPARMRRGKGRDLILEAALDLFASRGFDSISTSDIAQLAGSSQSVVLYHFATKEDLWREAMRSLFARIDVRHIVERDIYKDLGPIDRFRILLRRFVLASSRHPQLGRVIYREGLDGGERLRWLVDELAKPQFKVFVDLIDELKAADAIGDWDPIALTLAIHGAGATLFNVAHLSKLLGEGDLFTDEMVRQQGELLVTLFGGLLMREGEASRQAQPRFDVVK